VTVLEVIQRSTDFLACRGVESARLQTELLLAHVLGVPRLRLYLDFERPLSAAQLDTLRALVKRRAAREPLQHILGTASFCGLELKVDRRVLVPRPETELLAERAWQFLGLIASDPAGSPRALDFGTGSGCLAIALALHCPSAHLVAVDTSEEALDVARENAARHGVADRIEFVAADGFAALGPGRAFDLIVANPPYLPTAEIEHLAPEVRDFDPRVALDGGPDGLRCLRQLAREASRFLRASGRLMVEFGDGQAEAVATLFGEAHWTVEATEPDLTGRARFLIARPAAA
jgi:release factor glutamine methyltransferase